MNSIKQIRGVSGVWFTLTGLLRGFIRLNVQMLIVRPVILSGAIVVVVSVMGALFPHPTPRGIDTLLQTVVGGVPGSPAGDDALSSLWGPLFLVFYSLLVLSGNIFWLLLMLLSACGRVLDRFYDRLWMRVTK